MADKQRMDCTIALVADDTEEWQSKDGQYSGVNVKVVFDTGVVGCVSTKPQYVQSHKDALAKLVGQKVNLEVEDRGQFGFKITDYPGKPGGGGAGGGKGGGNPRAYAAQYALLAAAYSGSSPEIVLEVAEKTYMPWLLKMAGAGTSAPGAAPKSAPPSSDPVIDKKDGQVPAPTASLPQIRALRNLAEAQGWDEATACEKAGVSYLGEILAADVPRLFTEWSAK